MTAPSDRPRPPARLRVGRRAVHLPTLGVLVVVWAMLYDEVSAGVLLSGVLVGLAVLLAFPMPAVDSTLRLRPWACVRLLARTAVDIVLASARVLRYTFAFGRVPHSSVIRVPLRTRSDLMLTGTAVALSVVPGSVLVEVRYATRTLFVHVLGAANAAAADAARADVLRLEERVVRAFGTREDIRLLEAAGGERGAR
ncbi:Na+/H+ antiporter subunit E [Marinitenerispora sediminis]|uniref:Na+/H+ antiporter subunit E n=1 Tax=Marinitenerispora sediminis TaxID=1931232 RepID=A0A368T9N1_9ACTN|nr:Na+/H+ antiporter subunit E [Marinitenerispora sediminis]RCV54768.1 Na+/H+ antiporter subunit E [Marinitenerispora sediminis]RCV60556.1 Na+/H+ antiporter subunit E [Marinitenerispora sediminis]RCV61022.1 Na+/H+ antiporter subunit E [Marinitenerispora sediminis]